MGLLTCAGTRMGLPLRRLPNLTVRESFVRDGYHGTSIFRLDVGRLAALLGQMAYRGEW
ncbi:MAG: hypothetical protein N2508_08055 [Anaerolineae bacterium]|nr:hypothetical protein [Anaerolineae bacterium]